MDIIKTIIIIIIKIWNLKQTQLCYSASFSILVNFPPVNWIYNLNIGWFIFCYTITRVDLLEKLQISRSKDQLRAICFPPPEYSYMNTGYTKSPAGSYTLIMIVYDILYTLIDMLKPYWRFW